MGLLLVGGECGVGVDGEDPGLATSQWWRLGHRIRNGSRIVWDWQSIVGFRAGALLHSREKSSACL